MSLSAVGYPLFPPVHSQPGGLWEISWHLPLRSAGDGDAAVRLVSVIARHGSVLSAAPGGVWQPLPLVPVGRGEAQQCQLDAM